MAKAEMGTCEPLSCSVEKEGIEAHRNEDKKGDYSVF